MPLLLRRLSGSLTSWKSPPCLADQARAPFSSLSPTGRVHAVGAHARDESLMLLGEDVSLAGQQPQRVALRKVVGIQSGAGMRPAVFRILLASRGYSSVVCRIGGAAQGDANYRSRSEGFQGYRKISFVPGRSSPDAVGGHSIWERHQARRKFVKDVASVA